MVSVEVSPAAMGLGEKDLLMEGGRKTVTVSAPVLLVSSLSSALSSGSTVAVLERSPPAVGVASTVALNDAPGDNVTVPPEAVHVSVPLEIAQAILPVPPGGVAPFVTDPKI